MPDTVQPPGRVKSSGRCAPLKVKSDSAIVAKGIRASQALHIPPRTTDNARTEPVSEPLKLRLKYLESGRITGSPSAYPKMTVAIINAGSDTRAMTHQAGFRGTTSVRKRERVPALFENAPDTIQAEIKDGRSNLQSKRTVSPGKDSARTFNTTTATNGN